MADQQKNFNNKWRPDTIIYKNGATPKSHMSRTIKKIKTKTNFYEKNVFTFSGLNCASI